MIKYLAGLVALVGWLGAAAGIHAEVLFVADEFPAMETLAAQLRQSEHLNSRVVRQDQMPAPLGQFSAVVVYIHKALTVSAEQAFMDYALGGGKLVLLHHSISSGKRTNDQWFAFLGVDLALGDVSRGGYKWIEPATLDLVNLNPGHFIMTNGVNYPLQLPFAPSGATKAGDQLPGFTLPDSEVYLNHVHTGPHTLLMGLRYHDPKSGVDYHQPTAGWVKSAGRGTVVYLMPGHRREDFENPAYSRIVRNAILFQP